MEQRVNVITFGVRDVAISLRFYQEAFDWRPSFAIEHTAFFDLGPVVFGLWSQLDDELGRVESPPAGAVTVSHNVRSPDEVDQVIDRAVKAGAEVASPAASKPWGGYSGHIADPDGHLWEIAHNPDWPLDDQGRAHPPW